MELMGLRFGERGRRGLLWPWIGVAIRMAFFGQCHETITEACRRRISIRIMHVWSSHPPSPVRHTATQPSLLRSAFVVASYFRSHLSVQFGLLFKQQAYNTGKDVHVARRLHVASP